MRIFVKLLGVALAGVFGFILLSATVCFGQGIQPFGSYADGFDTINLTTLAPHIVIPLYTHTGRGSQLQTSIQLTYDDSSSSEAFLPGDLGWILAPSISNSGVLSRSVYQTTSCRQPQGTLPQYYYNTAYAWTFTDDTGFIHTFPGASWDNYCPSGNETTVPVSEYPGDGSSYLLHATGYQATVTDPNGRTFFLSHLSVLDPNGNSVSIPSFAFNGTSQVINDNTNNQITVSGGHYITNSAGVATSRTPFVGTYVDGSGTQRTFTVNWKIYSVVRASIWGPNVTQTLALVDNVQLADGSQYSMTYQPSSTVSGAVTGRLSSITVPTGGTISYTYANDPGPAQFQTKLIRTTPDGVTTYSTSVSSTYASNNLPQDSVTTISKADLSSEQISFAGLNALTSSGANNGAAGFFHYETKHLWLNSSGTTVKSSMRCYNGGSGDCTTSAVTLPISQLSDTLTLDNGQSSKAVKTMNSGGLLTELDEYDFGSTSITRRTVTQYAALGNNIVGKPSSVIVYDASGAVVRKTTYGYDETSLAPAAGGATLPGLASVTGSRGNLTTKTAWIDGSTNAAMTYAYDTAGQVVSEQDSKSNITSYVFDTATDAYLTQRTLPTINSVKHVDGYTVDPATGLTLSHTDENNIITAYEYNDPFLRLTKTRYAAGTSIENWTQYKYDSPNQTRILVDKVTVGDAVLVSKTVKDSLGRTISNIAPSGAEVDTTYDNMGRTHSTSNPYFPGGSGTPVLAIFGYDALGRKLSESYIDGTKKTWSYSGATVTAIDEAQHSWIRTSDALGRLVTVTEPTTLSTSYFYSGADDLKSVKQSGTGSDTARNRIFTYDLLSRLISSNNPETGAITYSYLDASGNRCSGVPSLPCIKTDARNVKTTYTYDALNRLTFRHYSDGTPTAGFGFDGNNESGTPLSSFGIASSYSIGRPSLTSNEVNAGSAYSYDVMGRIITKTNDIPGKPGWNTLVSAAYDLAGDTTSLTYPDGRVIQQGFDAAARMSGITYVSWNGSATNPPQPYFSESNGYDAAGHLIAATVGSNLPYLSAAYDTRERLSTQTYGPSSAPAWSKQYAWTSNSNLQSQTDLITGVQRQFAYDNLNRLTSAQDIYSNLAVPSGSNGQTGSTSTSGSGAEETPGVTGAIPLWTDPNDSNLLINADAPGTAGWGATNATIVDGVPAPDGTMSASTFTASAGSADTFLADSASSASLYDGETVTGSVWLRSPAGNQTINLYFVESGSAGYDIPAYKQVVLTSSWQQYQLSGQFHYGHQTMLLQIGGGGSVVAGQSVSLWGAMLQDTGTSSATITNFLPFSQRVTATSWGLNALATDNAAQAPDGTATAASVTGTSADSFITDTVKNPAPYTGQTITASVWLRAPSGSQRLLVTLLEDGNTPVGGVYANLTGAWQRFQVSGTNSHTLNELALQIGGASTWSNGQVVQVWGAQMEFASTAGPYVATAGVPEGKEANLTNILPYSQQLSGASWGTSGVILANNALAAPDGSITAAQMTGPQGATDAYITNDVPNPSLYDAATVTGSVFLRCPSGTKTLGLYIAAENSSGRTYLGSGFVTLTTTWQRFTYTGQLPNALTRLFLQIGGSSTFQAGQVVDVWGAQMELASHAGPYVRTTALPVITGSEPVNILPVSQVLNGPSWGIANGTATPNVAGAPDGTSTAATVTATSTSSDTYAANSVPNPSLYDGQTVTASIYLRVASGTLNTDLFLINVGANGWSAPAQTAVTITTSWQRFAVTGTNQNGLSQLLLQIGGASTITAGQSFQLWGPQMVLGSDPAPYTPTSSSTTVYATGQAGTLVQNGLNQSYSYDSFGNILQNGSFESSYTANNQMVGFAYDAAGNVLSDGMNIMTWDAESRMATAAGATYIYDGEGNRVEKQSSTITDTVYFGGQPIARYSGGQWTDLIYGPTGLLAEVQGTPTASPVYRVTDNLGTNVGSLLANGTFVNPVDHTPFGQTFSGNTSDPYLFTSKERDSESNLDYFGARYYSSNVGRWMSPDWAATPTAVPYSYLTDPQSLNLYEYVGNNPVGRADFDGHLEDMGDFFANLDVLSINSVRSQSRGKHNDLRSLWHFITSIFTHPAPVTTPTFAVTSTLVYAQLVEGSAEDSAEEALVKSAEPPTIEPTEETFLPDVATLPVHHAQNFDYYTYRTLDKPIEVYRTWGGSAGIEGRDGTYYSLSAPEGSPDAIRQLFALLPEWGNTLENTNAVTIPAGTTVYIGPAAPQTSQTGVTYTGGGIQVYVPH
jgi:RHS repeat-associated protein